MTSVRDMEPAISSAESATATMDGQEKIVNSKIVPIPTVFCIHTHPQMHVMDGVYVIQSQMLGRVRAWHPSSAQRAPLSSVHVNVQVVVGVTRPQESVNAQQTSGGLLASF